MTGVTDYKDELGTQEYQDRLYAEAFCQIEASRNRHYVDADPVRQLSAGWPRTRKLLDIVSCELAELMLDYYGLAKVPNNNTKSD